MFGGAMAPGLARAARTRPPPGSRLAVSDVRSVRGVDALDELEALDVPPVRLEPVARLPRLRELFISRGRRRPVDLRPLAACPALETLFVEGALALHTDALATLATLRAVAFTFARSPDLRPLARRPLLRLELDGVWGVEAWQLEGLRVQQLDLWGCGLADLDVLATMPNLREVWLHGNRVRSLRPLLHLGAGAKVVLDGAFDPDRHRAEIEHLEARGVELFAGDPHDHGVQPSWWTGTSSAPEEERTPIRYRTAPKAAG